MNSVVMIIRTHFNMYTYCSVSIVVDGEHIGKTSPSYGSASQGIFYAMELLKSKGYLEDWMKDSRGYCEVAWRYFSDRNIKFYYEEIPVKSSKEL